MTTMRRRQQRQNGYFQLWLKINYENKLKSRNRTSPVPTNKKLDVCYSVAGNSTFEFYEKLKIHAFNFYLREIIKNVHNKLQLSSS